MKNILFVLTLILGTLVSYSQDRVNRSKISFDQSSEILNNSIGWKYNETLGEWVDYENIISDDTKYKGEFKSLQGMYMKSRSVFNFNSLQIKTISFNGKKYYVLINNQFKGRYRYPSIQQDWIQYEQYFGFIFDEIQFTQLKKYNNIKSSKKVVYDLEFESYNESIFLDLIQTEILKPSMNSSYDNYSMLVVKSNNDKIRFLTPEMDMFFEEKKYSNFTTKPIYDFKKMYFETDINNFNKILNLN
jgi:hypothetical protein